MGILSSILKINKYINQKVKFWYCIVGFIFIFTLLFFVTQSGRPAVIFFSVPFLILFIIVYSLTKSIIKSVIVGIILSFLTLFILIIIALGGGH